MKKLPISLFVIAGTITAMAATLTNRPIARVGGETILLSDFDKGWQTVLEQQKQNGSNEKMDDAWVKDTRSKLLEQMVDDKVLLGEAKSAT